MTQADRAAAFRRDFVSLPVLDGSATVTLGYPGRPLIRPSPGGRAPRERALGLVLIALQVPSEADAARSALRLACLPQAFRVGADGLARTDPDGNRLILTEARPSGGQ